MEGVELWGWVSPGGKGVRVKLSGRQAEVNQGQKATACAGQCCSGCGCDRVLICAARLGKGAGVSQAGDQGFGAFCKGFARLGTGRGSGWGA